MKKNVKSRVFEYAKYPALIVACLAALGMMYRYGYKWLTVPERVEAAEQKIDTIEEYIETNQAILEAQQQWNKQQQNQQPTEIQICVSATWYEDAWWCWDERGQQWYKAGG